MIQPRLASTPRGSLYLDKRIIFYGTFQEFCSSTDMTGLFGHQGQHLICRMH
jgi:zinc transport system ATP-binding protein